MRKAILRRFVLVLMAALLLNSVIFYIAAGRMILKNAVRDMNYSLELIDSMIDYEGDLKAQAEHLREQVLAERGGRLTLIFRDGTVAADTGADAQELGNHLDRKEVREALEQGSGSARRRSGTLGITMLYTACISSDGQMILRIAEPYSGMGEYMHMLLPALFFSFVTALAVTALVTERLADSVTRPLLDISQEMQKVKGNYTEFHFEPCAYPEINVISETTMKMSQNVKDYLNQIEKERQIRQEFFSNASHELKTPITSIQGYAELLESGMITDQAMTLDFAKRIRKEALNMTGLINDILMISRLETKEAEVTFSQVHISVVVEEVLDSLKPQAASGQVFIHVDCQPLMINANLQQMKELISNLLSNAVKYNHPGGQVWLNIRERDGYMVIRVKDNGIGIPEESVDRIFERFFRVDKGRSRKQGGTGLGLAIVKHIVNFYHGSIQVQSKLDQGTEFTVSLPMGEREENL